MCSRASVWAAEAHWGGRLGSVRGSVSDRAAATAGRYDFNQSVEFFSCLGFFCVTNFVDHQEVSGS